MSIDVRVAQGDATVAIAPSESAISYHTHPDYPSLTAIAAIYQRDTSAIVTLELSGINRPKKLDNFVYASYDARFEDHMLLDGTADATWVFMSWEGVQAEFDGVALNAFALDEYDVSYGYTPVLLADPKTVDESADELSRFLDATRRGYEFATEHPDEAVALLASTAEGPRLDDEEFLVESQRRISTAYCSAGVWGRMRRNRWAEFVEWLDDESLLQTLDGDHLPADDVDALYTNTLID